MQQNLVVNYFTNDDGCKTKYTNNTEEISAPVRISQVRASCFDKSSMAIFVLSFCSSLSVFRVADIFSAFSLMAPVYIIATYQYKCG